jgi:hypothetical protein
MTEFMKFNKIARFSREVIITEKIDGTNAQIYIGEDGEFLTGSRNRWITPDDDNFGFSAWAHEHKDELMELGPGHHFGEWWGCGIQRRYGLDHKRFSLFNIKRWSDPEVRPDCCHVVPILATGPMEDETIAGAMLGLRCDGSTASPGFDNPEGIIIYHTASGTLFKKTFEKDESGKEW